MQFLYFLESIRCPALDAVFRVITELGGETVYMALAIAVYWCVSKGLGCYILTTGFVGTIANQFLKLCFRIPRPWVLDPDFTIVESARAGATGYSFPSGHTQNAFSSFGCLGMWVKRGWRVLCFVIVVLIGLSRMYLGVHTPLDVGVSLGTGLITVLGLHGLFQWAEGSLRRQACLGGGIGLFVLALVLYVTLAPARPGSDPLFDAHGVDAAWKLLGSTLGIVIAWLVDGRWLHFDTGAVWWAQVCKLALGLALVLGIRVGLKPLLGALVGDAAWAGGVRYLLMTLVGGILWPMTFGFWGRLGRRQERA